MGVGKPLNQVIKYVAEASKCFDHCQELQTLLLDIKPIVEREIENLNGASSSTSHLPGGAASWLRELKPQLETVEDQLKQALTWLNERKKWVGVPFDITTKHKWSRSILKITEGIRKVAHDHAPFVNLECTLHASRAVQELTISYRRIIDVDISQLVEDQMELAELRLTKLVDTELCKVGGDECHRD
ncbi:hypothetical protein O6H91_12G064400 [Diphasiastrum complanatum]|uniref:Uncharacterized protein n=1 Tax=Diphasiastrum complanatum TaxID=34168 RepID=A0ACC2C3B6_DIPCM|nr:hypothetical protein O6H91_12G064400 [Diphasiastrum complanatum]